MRPWQTTFVLVKAGTSSGQATLSFFADATGAPLSLPLAFPQSGGGTVTTAPSLSQIIPAGATTLASSGGAPRLLTGSAQLSKYAIGSQGGNQVMSSEIYLVS